MTVIEKESILQSIKHKAIKLTALDDCLGIYQFINHSLTQQKEKIETLSIDLIIVENIYPDYDKLDHQEREVINIFTYGDFSQDSEITWQLSEILADFLVEYLIIPILNNINYVEFERRKGELLKNINDGIIVYESKRCLS